jgi:hypothetical protein
MWGQQRHGLIRILADTILIFPNDAYCLPSRYYSPTNVVYNCQSGGQSDVFNVSIDRRNPVTQSRWSASRSVQKRREICVRYESDARGNRVCAERGWEQYEERESRAGQLVLRRQPP